MSVEQEVRRHFHADARRFDAIYNDDKGMLARWIDGVWRGVVRQRFALTLRYLEPLDGKSILDIGCGSGRYCIASAERGASRVVGVDFAPAMITLAQQYARQAGVADRCEFRVGTFPEAIQDGPFDACTAMGFFDYVAAPAPLLMRMRELSQSVMIMSFPKAREWRIPVRRLRLWLQSCPLFLYSERQVKTLLSQAGITHFEWLVLDRDYLVVARP